MPILLPNGIGASLGDRLVVNKPLHKTGLTYFVSSVVGDDNNTGLSRLDPMATLSTAYTAAVAGDWIVIAADHAQTLTGTQTIGKALTIVGEGQAAGKPTAGFTNNQPSSKLFNVTVSDVQIVNLLFPAQAQACSAVRIDVGASADRFVMRGCYLEADGNSDNAIISLAADQVSIESTTFISTSVRQTVASNNAPPSQAMTLAAAMDDLRMNGVTFDGGQIGFTTTAITSGENAAVTRLRADNMSFLNGADYTLDSATTGYLNVQTSSGSVNGTW